MTVVIPFLNALTHLRVTLPQVLAAAARRPGVELIYVDNGSTDGSLAYLEHVGASSVRVLSLPGATIARMRNWGARHGSGDYVSFLDADCGIDPEYFNEAVTALQATGAAATGCEVSLPPHPHWLERTLYGLHHVGRDRDVSYINSANFFVRRSAYEAIGGFREDLRTDEDSDIGARLIAAGHRLRECTRVRAIHYGNPRTLGEHYRRTVWHSMGMFAGGKRSLLDPPNVMLGAHLVATAAAVAQLFVSSWPISARIAIAFGSQVAVPTITVAYRAAQTRRVPPLGASVLTYAVYYWARAEALFRIVVRRTAGYRK